MACLFLLITIVEVTCGIYLFDLKQSKLLIGHAARTSKNNWSIPKGLKEESENEYQAAVREFKEETGIDLNRIKIKEKVELPEVKYKNRNKVLRSFLVKTDTSLSDATLTCTSLVKNSYPEIDNFLWVTIDELDKYVHETQRVNILLIKTML